METTVTVSKSTVKNVATEIEGKIMDAVKIFDHKSYHTNIREWDWENDGSKPCATIQIYNDWLFLSGAELGRMINAVAPYDAQDAETRGYNVAYRVETIDVMIPYADNKMNASAFTVSILPDKL